jgi:hypothetical protein
MAEASSTHDDHHGEAFFDESAKKWDSKPGVLETTENVYNHLLQHLEKTGCVVVLESLFTMFSRAQRRSCREVERGSEAYGCGF